jgi:hypothetical protein
MKTTDMLAWSRFAGDLFVGGGGGGGGGGVPAQSLGDPFAKAHTGVLGPADTAEVVGALSADVPQSKKEYDAMPGFGWAGRSSKTEVSWDLGYSFKHFVQQTHAFDALGLSSGRRQQAATNTMKAHEVDPGNPHVVPENVQDHAASLASIASDSARHIGHQIVQIRQADKTYWLVGPFVPHLEFASQH